MWSVTCELCVCVGRRGIAVEPIALVIAIPTKANWKTKPIKIQIDPSPAGCSTGNFPLRLAHPKMLKTDPTKSLKSVFFSP